MPMMGEEAYVLSKKYTDKENVKQMPISGGTFTGITKAQSNTSYATAQLRNVILSTEDANVNLMGEGDIWIKYEMV